jgi:hypothetical protein
MLGSVRFDTCVPVALLAPAALAGCFDCGALELGGDTGVVALLGDPVRQEPIERVYVNACPISAPRGGPRRVAVGIPWGPDSTLGPVVEFVADLDGRGPAVSFLPYFWNSFVVPWDRVAAGESLTLDDGLLTATMSWEHRAPSAGDRFALPLYPLLLVWGWEAIAAPWKGSVRATRVVGGIAALLFLIPAAGAWGGARVLATQCREAVARGGPWACYAPPVQDWVEAARWAGVALPDGAVVFNRKPSLHYVVSGGVRSRIFPFDEDPAAFFQVAGAVGVRYLVLDRLDGVSARYALPAIEAHPGRFCSIMGWGDPEGGQTVLLGILPPAAWTAADAQWEATDQVTLPVCSSDYVRETPRAGLPPTSGRIPLLP